MHVLDELKNAGFDVSIKVNDNGPLWTVTAMQRAVIRNPDGSLRRGVGDNVFMGAGDTIDGAVCNLAGNAVAMAMDLDAFVLSSKTEPDNDSKTAKETQPKVVECTEGVFKFQISFDADAFVTEALKSIDAALERAIDIREAA